MRVKRFIASLTAVCGVATMTVLGAAPAAQADSSCWEPLCSSIINHSTLGVYIAQDWCWSGTTGSSRTEDPYCSSSSERKWLNPGAGTAMGEDWDTFRVDAGYCYKVQFNLPYDTWTQYYNQSGTSTHRWVKVEDHANAYIKAQKYGSCP